MDLTALLSHYPFSPETSESPQVIKGMVGSQASLVAASQFSEAESDFVFILNDKEEAAYFLNDLEKLIGEKRVFFFPGSYRRPYQIEETDNANVLLRAEVLNRLNSRRKPAAIVTYPDALFERVVTKKTLSANTLKLANGEQIDIDFLNETLFEYRFERVDFVTEPGQFSIRGGIVDIFSYANENPYRVEFFGNEVDSIRTFDIESQLSIKTVSRMEIVPNIEDKKHLEKRESFLQYLKAETTLWVKSLSIAQSVLDKNYDLALAEFEKLSADISHAAPAEMFCNGESLESDLLRHHVFHIGVETPVFSSGSYTFDGKPQPSFNKNFELLTETLQSNTAKGWTNYITCSSQKQVERFYSIFEDLGSDVEFQPIVGSLHEGFEDPEKGIVVYTDHQIFERYQRFRLKTGLDKKQAITLQELNSLQYGDYVTHIDHGIGKFGGLQKIQVDNKVQEAIKLTYKDNDVLYISIHSLHKIAKYNGKEGTAPTVHKLGTQTWQNLKKKTKTKVKTIAYNLIELYAKRKEAKGFAYAPDSYLQHELEASFIYEDTPDQIKSTLDVKADMESSIPMDRLICGDVGFGKTEVAMRAAFKAVANGKQVAILVPTTILAFQHFKTFSERLKDFPVTVDYINRFKTGKKQTETLKNLAEGKVDIIIGTHRLVGKDVSFKDLGLLIIDEEQKFGVSVKDKLKTLKVNIDTLTLTATPIPRTLQFSLMAARDLSVMTTPPPNRHPIETEVIGFNEEAIRDAIQYEISRGGQVFFINNRIENIHDVAGMIQRLVPGAKVGIGHGQMDGKKLEEMLIQFMEGQFDVLVSTTIIESGLDVPNANTILINNAQNFGLSDLHQMRGRVGRSNKQAFCKLIAPPYSALTEEARKRLQALEQFSDLGSGFKIAMRDLEIRGAGDMLGAEQSGFIADMGFETYQKILAEAVKELKENEFKDLYADSNSADITDFVDECQLDTDLALHIPDHYVNNIEERLRLYQELDSIANPEDLEAYRKRLEDRFGSMPEEAEELIKSMRLRWLGKEVGFEKIILKNGSLLGMFISSQDSPYFQSPIFAHILSFLQSNPQRVEMKQKNDKLRLIIRNVKSVDEALQLVSPLKLQESGKELTSEG